MFFVWVMQQRSRREIIISVGMVYIGPSSVSVRRCQSGRSLIYGCGVHREALLLDSFLTRRGYLFSLLVSRKSPLPSISFLEFVFHTVAGTTL